MSTGISKVVAVGMVTAEPVINAAKDFVGRVQGHMETLKQAKANPLPAGISDEELREALELIQAKRAKK